MTIDAETATVAKCIDHLGVVVSDLERSVDWYGSVLGAVPLADVFAFPGGAARNRVLDLGGLDLELIEATTPGRPYDLQASDAGALHICLQQTDLHGAYERIVAQGFHPTTPPGELVAGTGILNFYVRDPDGILIQMFQLPPELAERMEARAAGHVHHLGFTTSDLERAVAWYERHLGLTVRSWHDNDGELLSEMFEIPDTIERAALVQAGPWRADGPNQIEVMVWKRPKGRPLELGLLDTGVMHVGFEVEDAEAAHAALAAAGAQIPIGLARLEGGYRDGWQSFYVADPDGLTFQILQPPA